MIPVGLPCACWQWNTSLGRGGWGSFGRGTAGRAAEPLPDTSAVLAGGGASVLGRGGSSLFVCWLSTKLPWTSFEMFDFFFPNIPNGILRRGVYFLDVSCLQSRGNKSDLGTQLYLSPQSWSANEKWQPNTGSATLPGSTFSVHLQRVTAHRFTNLVLNPCYIYRPSLDISFSCKLIFHTYNQDVNSNVLADGCLRIARWLWLREAVVSKPWFNTLHTPVQILSPGCL